MLLLCPVWSASAVPFVDVESVDVLSRHPLWLKLLHYSRHGQRSEINSDDFFLSATGKTDPAAELRATLAAYFEPWLEDTDRNARCRFPARYFWLSQQIDLPGYGVREPRCGRLERWATPDRLRSVSLLLVSGYFGNPASTFGHALLRLNTGDADDPNMLDVTINYGALVPKNELMALYVYRGLFGGYQSGFSDKYFYTEDMVYARNEMRDLWEYELNLSDDQIRLLAFHLWEVIGKKFTYHFLTQNCAYRLAELLELITDEPWLTNTRVWYVPVEMFHRLNTLDAASPGRLVRSVHFIPSSQRELRHQFSALTPSEAATANLVIRDPGANLGPQLAVLPAQRQAAVNDALLAYYHYRLVAEEPEPSVKTRAAKDAVLRERLRLPVRSDPDSPPFPLPSPAERSAPMLTAAGLGVDAGNRRYARVQFAAFSYDQVGSNSLENGELVVFDVAAGVDDQQRTFVDRFDLVRARKLNTNRVQIAGEDAWSWQTRVGGERIRRDGREHFDGLASFGVGRAAQWNDTLTAYAMVDGSVQTGPSPVSVEPNLGVTAGIGRWKSWVQTGARYEVNVERWRHRLHAEARYQLAQHQALVLELTSDAETRRAVLSFRRYW